MELIKQEREIELKPLNEELRVFHFSFFGLEKTALENAVIHGWIFLPENYPYGPPTISFLNVN